LPDAKSLWKIAYFHHPPFSAAPNYKGNLPE